MTRPIQLQPNPIGKDVKRMGSHPLKLFWVAWYDKPFPARDVETLPQFDLFNEQTGKETLFGEINQARVKSFVLFPFSPEQAAMVNRGGDARAESSTLPQYVVHLGDGKRLIHVRRSAIHMQNIDKPVILGREIIYLLGWQTTELLYNNGNPQERNRKAVMFIKEDGSVELMDQAGTPDERVPEREVQN